MEADSRVHTDVRAVAIVDEALVDVTLCVRLVLTFGTVGFAVAHQLQLDTVATTAVKLRSPVTLVYGF